MTSTSERRGLAEMAVTALDEYLTDCADMLWPEERKTLRKARVLLAKEAEE